jgi:hypothetical protein
MGSDAPSIRGARQEDAPLLAAAERAIASVRGSSLRDPTKSTMTPFE